MSLLTVSSLAVAGVASVHADTSTLDTFRATRNAVKSYHLDKKTVTDKEATFNSYRYIVIPAKYQQIGDAWNYKRYLHTNFYQGGY